jgi:hypothetical protein
MLRLFVRVPVCGARVFVSSLAMFVRRGRMGFCLIVLALRMLMRRLMMVMGSGLMRSSSALMMFARRMLG